MLLRSPYRYLLAAAVLAAMLCLLPARGADAPVQTEKSLELTARQSDAPQEEPAGADLSDRTQKNAYLHQTLYYAPCGHSVQRREKLPAKLVGLTRGALESEIGSASSPMTFNGVSSHIGSVSSFRRAPSPPFLIPLY